MTSGKTAFLGAVLALAFALRLAGLDFGLPHTKARPDEETVLDASLSIARDGTPGFFNYPSLYPNLLLAALAGRYAFGRFSGEYSGTQDLVEELALSPENFVMLDRVIVVMFGTSTVWLVFLLARRLWGRDDTGIVAALLLAVAYLHVRESHFGTVDIPLTFFALLGTIACLRAMERPGMPTLVVAGLTAGLATSIKYNGVALAVPLALAACFGTDSRSSPQRIVRLRYGRLRMAAGCMLLGFLLGTPYLFWDWDTFAGDASGELIGKMSAGSFLGVDLGRGWIRHVVFSLRHGVGAPLLLACLYGCILGLRQSDRRAFLITAAFPICWWLGVGASGTVFVRYALPLVPYVVVFAAGALCHWVELYRLRVLGQWFDGIRFYAAASSPRRSRRTWAGLR